MNNSAELKPVAVLGGTFDPIHFGHLRPALEIMEALRCDSLRLIPSHIPPHRKRPDTTSQQRAEMVALAIQNHGSFVLDERELRRDGPSYSVDTLASIREEIAAQRPLCLIMGMDAFAAFPSWHRWQDILSLAHVVVTHRPGSPASQDVDLGEWLDEVRTECIDDVHAAPCGRVLFYPVTQLDISATAIRKRIASGLSPRYLLPSSVWAYIGEHGLYGFQEKN